MTVEPGISRCIARAMAAIGSGTPELSSRSIGSQRSSQCEPARTLSMPLTVSPATTHIQAIEIQRGTDDGGGIKALAAPAVNAMSPIDPNNANPSNCRCRYQKEG